MALIAVVRWYGGDESGDETHKKLMKVVTEFPKHPPASSTTFFRSNSLIQRNQAVVRFV